MKKACCDTPAKTAGWDCPESICCALCENPCNSQQSCRNQPVKSVETLTTEILILKQQTAQNIIEIGKRLIEVKKSLGHGEWGKYLEEKVEFSQWTAQKFIRIANEFSNSGTFTNLNYSKAIALLDLPSDQRETFIQNNPVEDMTTRQLQAAIKAQKEAERRAQEAETAAEVERETRKTLEVENKNLKTANNLLEDKLKSADDPIIVEQPVQVFPPDYERIKRENAELKARQQNISVQQLAQADEKYKHFMKTVIEEEKAAKIIHKLIEALLNLPTDNELEELVRCYLKCSSAEVGDEITVTCHDMETGINKMRTIIGALKNSMKLKVVK